MDSADKDEVKKNSKFEGSSDEWTQMVNKAGFDLRFATEIRNWLEYLPTESELETMMHTDRAHRMQEHFGIGNLRPNSSK